MATLPGASSNLSSFHLADEKTRGLKLLAQDQPGSTLPLDECPRGVGMWSMPWAPHHTPSTASSGTARGGAAAVIWLSSAQSHRGKRKSERTEALPKITQAARAGGWGARAGVGPEVWMGAQIPGGLAREACKTPKLSQEVGTPRGPRALRGMGCAWMRALTCQRARLGARGATGVTAGPSWAPIKPRQREASAHRVGDGGAGGGCAPGLPAQRQGMARLGARSEGAGERDWSGEKAQPAPVSAPSGSTGAPLPRGPCRAAPGGGDVHWGSAARAA